MKNILLIEDDTEMCEIIRHYFAEKGTAVFAVQHGGKAAEMIRDGIEDYELVLLDIMLPETDGFTLCRMLRRQSDIPVIFITARGREEDILSALDGNAVVETVFPRVIIESENGVGEHNLCDFFVILGNICPVS